MAFLEFLIAAVALLVLAGELALGAFVLANGQRRAAPRFLGAFLLAHAALFLPESIIQLFFAYPENADPNAYEALWSSGAALLPPLLVGFAFSYPTVVRPFAGRKRWVPLLFLPTGAVVTALWIGRFVLDTRALDIGLILIFLVATFLAVAVFAARLRRAVTALERQRLRWMLRVLGLPLAAVLVVLTVYIGLFSFIDYDALPAYVLTPLAIAFLAFLFLPPVGLAVGLLRYHVLDFRLRMRFTVQQGFVVTLFVVAFYVVSEGAQVVLADRLGSAGLGVLGAAVLLLFLVPLERAARRVAERVIPGPADTQKYREFRKWEVYRAAYEDFSKDQQVTEPERRLLDALVRSLGLEPSAAATIESEATLERQTANQDE